MNEKSPAHSQTRRILAPHILPAVPPALKQAAEGPLYYLSWPGWELYLTRRLGLAPAGPEAPQPLLLPNAADAKTDFKAIDQLNTIAAQMGANFFTLAADSSETLPAMLASIRCYQGEKAATPILDDRAYLALWAINDYQTRQNEALLAQARLKEQQMWAALKGEDAPPASSSAQNETAPAEPDRRTLYAWRAWRRLAEGALAAGDIVVPTADGSSEATL